ncbi:MAG: NAD(P)H-hydrate dehydratase [Bdellovibrionales bacterium]|nr:NAD(P)H-hydrate dehydratase [Bdellovibrionales bacterium]
MRLATREEIYSIDKAAADEYGLSSSLLIEKAGAALAGAFENIFRQRGWLRVLRIGVWCGPGNNGADGRVMAHLLREKDFRVEVLQGTAWKTTDYDIIVDALFGVGLNRPIEGELAKKIEELNQADCTVIALDIPSGLDANRGVILGACVKAAWTLTVAPAKPGLFLQEGPAQSGRIRSLQIGFPPELLRAKASSVFLIGSASAKKLLPSRRLTSNKTSFGHLLVIAGSQGMEGAALLTSEAAARMGCGYVTLCSPSKSVWQKARPDFLNLSLTDFFKSDLKKYKAVVVGPGLGVNKQTEQILVHLYKHHDKVLVDAGALTVLAQKPLGLLPEGWILTPHAGELSRFVGTPAKELEADRLQAVASAQKQLGGMVLLKGFRTVLGTAVGKYIIGSGNVALAKAGSGDVLSGFIGSLMAQGLPTDRAGVLGAYLHGRIADDWLRRGHSSRTLMASDLPELIDASLTSLKKGR